MVNKNVAYAGLIVSVAATIGVVGFSILPKPAAATPPCSVNEVQLRIIETERPAMGVLERIFWAQAIAAASAKHALPADVVTAKIAQESRFKAHVISNRGAKGPAQLMDLHVKGFDPFEIEANLDKGAEVLAGELKRTNGDLRKALRRYNGGNDAEQIPVTAAYADAILARVYLAREKACAIKVKA